MAVALSATASAAFIASPVSLAEVVQEDGVRVSVQSELSPTKLPRSGKVPVAVSIGGQITAPGGGVPPRLLSIRIAINSHGRLTYKGIPRCRIGHISPSTTNEAISVCRRSLVGEGIFKAAVKLPEQSPFPSHGKMLAFNGVFRGKPAILAHVYGTQPTQTSYVLPFTISRTKGTYGTVLEAFLPNITGDWGYITGISLRLDRTFKSGGKTHSYLAADCPAPKGFPGVTFPLARTSFSFEGGKTLSAVMNRTCKVKG